MKTRRNLLKRAALVVALCAGSALVAGTASAEGYGTGLNHHSELGYRGAAGHLNYGDYLANQVQMHHGIHPSSRHAGQYSGTSTSGYRGYASPMNYSVTPGYHTSMRYTGPMSAAGQPTGNLQTGMVLPDGAVVVSVGQ